MGWGGLEKGWRGSAVDHCLGCLQLVMDGLTGLGHRFVPSANVRSRDVVSTQFPDEIRFPRTGDDLSDRARRQGFGALPIRGQQCERFAGWDLLCKGSSCAHARVCIRMSRREDPDLSGSRLKKQPTPRTQEGEEFYVCAWSQRRDTGAPLLLVAGKHGMIHVLDCQLGALHMVGACWAAVPAF